MKREFSAGGIVFNDKGEVLVINNAAMRDPSRSYWGFPKGHIETGETGKEAAVREIKEETGIKAEVTEKLGDSKYIFTHKGEKIFKVVSYFLMKYLGGELKKQEAELLDVVWMDPKGAMEKLSFKKDKDMLRLALESYGK